MVREVSRNDYDKALTIERWPLVELFHAYQAHLKSEAHAYYLHALLMWASGSRTNNPPKPPRILRE